MATTTALGLVLTLVLSWAVWGQAVRPAGAAPTTASAPASQAAYPLWNGKEKPAEYAKRAGIKDVEQALDLGKGINLKATLIPAGKFMMGASKEELDIIQKMGGRGTRGAEEQPQHEVTITRPFYMGVYTVTQEQYGQLMTADPSTNKGARLPAEGEFWTEAVDFCKKLSEKTGQAVRLPTEAEWEYACRAGTTTAFNFGDQISSDQANYEGTMIWDKGKKGVYRGKSMPVGTFKPNAWGLYEMHGNITQWCSDWYDKDYYARSPAVDPKGPDASSDNPVSRVSRGGSWGYGPRLCRSASRSGMQEWRKLTWTGFRVVVELK
jgi:formylglycine-generating enzyme required for sulfatase activity